MEKGFWKEIKKVFKKKVEKRDSNGNRGGIGKNIDEVGLGERVERRRQKGGKGGNGIGMEKRGWVKGDWKIWIKLEETYRQLTNPTYWKEFYKIVTEEHNFINLFWFNFHRVDEGIYRSAQLTPWRLRKIVKKYGIKTIINLRARENYLYRVEEEICFQLGVHYQIFSIASRTLPKGDEVERLSHLLQTLPKPILIHCKAGADRTGFVSALWHTLKGRPGIEAVQRELKMYYGYFPLGRVGKIRELFLNYPGKVDFIKWYYQYRDLIEESYQSKGIGEFFYNLLGRE